MKHLKIMIKLSVLFSCIYTLNAQENNLVFSYDKAGNLMQRKVQTMVGGRLGKINSKDSSHVQPAENFKVFPNPTNQYINLEGDLPVHILQADVILSNLEGKVLKTDQYYGKTKALDISTLKSGMYLLEMRYSKEERTTYKIIITTY